MSKKPIEDVTFVRSTRPRRKPSRLISTSSVRFNLILFVYKKGLFLIFETRAILVTFSQKFNFRNELKIRRMRLRTVPPTIEDSASSSDVIVREGSDLSLTCQARGSPTPSVKWRREDGRKISTNKSFSS
jgi:hypothetical protein